MSLTAIEHWSEQYEICHVSASSPVFFIPDKKELVKVLLFRHQCHRWNASKCVLYAKPVDLLRTEIYTTTAVILKQLTGNRSKKLVPPKNALRCCRGHTDEMICYYWLAIDNLQVSFNAMSCEWRVASLTLTRYWLKPIMLLLTPTDNTKVAQLRNASMDMSV